MEKGRKAGYLEEISHTTKTAPYSIHRSFFAEGSENALYLHWHPEMEFYYLERGELEFVVEDICYRLRAGEAVFVPPNLLHMARGIGGEGTQSGRKGSFRALVFSPDLLATPARLTAFQKYVRPVLQNPAGFCLHLTGEEAWQAEALADLLRLFTQEGCEEEPELLVTGLVQVIWQNLYCHYFRRVAGERMTGHLGTQLEETLTFIHEHYQEELTLGMLAKTAHMSEGQFCRSFKQLTGNTPFSYLKRYRILKSCVYLAESEKKISEVCMLCGFNNISYFNREFLKMMKIKPSAYRVRCRMEKEDREQTEET